MSVSDAHQQDQQDDDDVWGVLSLLSRDNQVMSPWFHVKAHTMFGLTRALCVLEAYASLYFNGSLTLAFTNSLYFTLPPCQRWRAGRPPAGGDLSQRSRDSCGSDGRRRRWPKAAQNRSGTCRWRVWCLHGVLCMSCNDRHCRRVVFAGPCGLTQCHAAQTCAAHDGGPHIL
jgi:hypothetical protein